MDIHSFTIYEEYFALVSILKGKKAEHLLYAIVTYMFKGIEPKLDTEEKAVFDSLKRALDKQKNKSKNAKKDKSNQNQNEIKMKSNENQNEIKTKTHQDVSVNVNNIINYIENNLNRIVNSYEYEQLELLVSKYSNEVVLYAFKKTSEAGKKSLNYTKGILKNWEQDNLKTLDEIKQQENNKNKKIVPEWFNKQIEQKQMTTEEEKEMNSLLNEIKEIN